MIYEPEPLLLLLIAHGKQKARANKQSFFIKMVLQLFLPLVLQTFLAAFIEYHTLSIHSLNYN